MAKMKKPLALLLALVMLMSTISMTVMATGTDPVFIPSVPDEVGKNYPLDKSLGTFKDDIAKITLSVPAEEVALGVDIVYIMGGGASSDKDVRSELSAAIKEIIQSGIPVNFGLVGFSTDKGPILDLQPMEESTMDKLISDAIDAAPQNYDGINMENALLKAQKMLAKSRVDNGTPANRQHLIIISSGQTYFFNDGPENDTFASVPVNINSATGKVNGEDVKKFFIMDKNWMQTRNTNPNAYPIPEDLTWDEYWRYIVKASEADIAAGDKYKYIVPNEDFFAWYYAGNVVSDARGTPHASFGGYVKPEALMNDNLNKHLLVDGLSINTSQKFVKEDGSLIEGSSASHAIGNERAMYEAWVVWEQLKNAGVNCYSVFNPMIDKNTGAQKYVNGTAWYSHRQEYIGHSFMNMLAGGKAPIYSSSNKAFFDPIKEAILYTVSDGTVVQDAIGYDAKEGNFEFITDVDTLKLVVNGKTYTTVMTASTTDAKGKIIEASYDFLDAEGVRKFSLDYHWGDGKEGEYFDWNFHTNVSMKDRVSLTYELELTDKSGEAGSHKVDTNRFAVLKPVDSNKQPGTPQLFPVPFVTYEVNPYDVDIVLALGAGIAKYDGVHSSYTHTYDSIVKLVGPLVEQGINVKLGLVAVEHYDDVALPLTVLTKDNYEDIITDGLNKIQQMPAGPTNLHGNIVAAKEMLDADKAVPDANKFFYVIATGRTYNFDNANGVPTTIINKVSVGGNTHYYWGHYLWQSQRGGHTSLYMIPAKYNNDFNAYWKDVETWVEADGNQFAYSFTDAYNVNDPQWFNTFMATNSTDLKAHKIASSRFGWLLPGLKNSGLAAIGSGSNPQNALNYERAQYEAWKAYQAMKAAGYTCEAISSETPNYQNGSEYIKQGAKYTGTSTIQLGDSFMDFLNGGEAKNLFDYTRDADGNLISTAAVFKTTEYFTSVDVAKLVKTEKAPAKGPMMMSPGPKKPAIEITAQPEDVEAALGEAVRITVKATGEGLKYQWFYKEANATEFAVSSIKNATYSVSMTKANTGRQIYCVITDANGNSVTTNTATLNRTPEQLAIVTQPTSTEAALGQAVKITVKATGEGLKYQWYYKEANATTFSASSIKNATYSVSMTKANTGRQVYCVITDVNGNTVTTDIATLNRTAEALAIVSQPADVEGALGDPARFTVKATGEGLKYQWFYKEAKATTFSVSSIKSATYSVSITKSNAGRQVYCVITDAQGNTVTTDVATLSLSK